MAVVSFQNQQVQWTSSHTTEMQRLKLWSNTEAAWATGELTVEAGGIAWEQVRNERGWRREGSGSPRIEVGRSEHQGNPSRFGSGAGIAGSGRLQRKKPLGRTCMRMKNSLPKTEWSSISYTELIADEEQFWAQVSGRGGRGWQECKADSHRLDVH